MRTGQRIVIGLGIGFLAGWLSAPIYHGMKNDYDGYFPYDSGTSAHYTRDDLEYKGSLMLLGGLAGAATSLRRRKTA